MKHRATKILSECRVGTIVSSGARGSANGEFEGLEGAACSKFGRHGFARGSW